MRSIIIVITLLFCCPLALASEWSGKVIELKSLTESNLVLFRLSGKLESPARCNELGMYAIDLNAPGGKALLEILKLAYTEGHLVEAKSYHTCSFHWESESVKEISVKP